jgi:plastocyanin
MMLRWVTYFSLGVAAWCGNVTGRVELTDAKSGGGKASKDDPGVIVWLEPTAGKADATAPTTASIAHKNKTFVPHVVALRTGSRVVFPNLDPFFHNAFSNYDGQVFDVGLHAPGSSREVTFRRPGVVRLFCNIHPTMSAVIVVLDTPYFASVNAKGEYSISSVPAADYRLRLFYERALPEALERLGRQITVGSGDVAVPSIAVSESGYLPSPHKNKFGKDYPAVIEDQYPNPAKKP